MDRRSTREHVDGMSMDRRGTRAQVLGGARTNRTGTRDQFVVGADALVADFEANMEQKDGELGRERSKLHKLKKHRIGVRQEAKRDQAVLMQSVQQVQMIQNQQHEAQTQLEMHRETLQALRGAQREMGEQRRIRENLLEAERSLDEHRSKLEALRARREKAKARKDVEIDQSLEEQKALLEALRARKEAQQSCAVAEPSRNIAKALKETQKAMGSGGGVMQMEDVDSHISTMMKALKGTQQALEKKRVETEHTLRKQNKLVSQALKATQKAIADGKEQDEQGSQLPMISERFMPVDRKSTIDKALIDAEQACSTFKSSRDELMRKVEQDRQRVAQRLKARLAARNLGSTVQRGAELRNMMAMPEKSNDDGVYAQARTSRVPHQLRTTRGVQLRTTRAPQEPQTARGY